MKCAPTFGAIPSVEDRKRKEEEASMVEEKRDEILVKLMNKDAARRLNNIEIDDPAKALGPAWSHVVGLAAQTKA